MSETELPEISVIDPEVAAGLMKLCTVPTSPHVIAQKPCIVDMGDELYVVFTDAASAVLVSLDLDETVPDLPSSPEIQEEFGRLTNRWGSPYALYYEGVSIEGLLAWCKEDISGCPKCKGKKDCYYPRYGTDAASRENPDVTEAHEGILEGVVIDRRRLLAPLALIGVEEGEVDVAVVDDPGEEGADQKGALSGVAVIGEGWRIYIAGKIGKGAERPKFTISG